MRIRTTATTSPPLADVLPLRTGLASELPRLADDLAGDVRRRTAQGRDVDGRRFARLKTGRPSTLQRTGKMVRSFQPREISDTGFTLRPGRAETARAAIHQAGSRNLPKRRWVGVTDHQIDEARERIAEAVLPEDR